MYGSIAAAVALACASLASPALANDEFVSVEGRVSRAGLNLADPSGAEEFNRRVARTARQICRRGLPNAYRYGRVVNECRASVMASGRQQLYSLAAEPRMALGD